MKMTSDVLVIGGGIIGLAIATELKLRGIDVTVLCRDYQEAATQAAAGMLAPQAEAIAPGPMLDLCLQSRDLYPEWIGKLEAMTGVTAGYWPCGILAPVFAPPNSTTLNGQHRQHENGHLSLGPHPTPAAVWLDREAIHHYQPGLGADVAGGWWFPEDGQVDNRALAKALLAAAQTLGVDVHHGVAVTTIQQRQRQVLQLQTSAGNYQAEHYVLATGAWSQELLPLPVQPKKGQMLSVCIPKDRADVLPLQRILFGPDTYLVPRRDRRLVIGATSEEVGFTPHNTPAGIQALLQRAIRLYPALENFPIDDIWWGFRPATPDEWPILGPSHCRNLTLATGHYRNGILLAPITAKLIANLIERQQAEPLLAHFRWERFQRSATQSCQPPPLTAHSPTHAIPKESKLTPDAALLQPMPNFAPSLEKTTDQRLDQPLLIAGREFHSRLMTGTGKYRNFELMRQSIAASGCQIVTVAVRRVQTQAPGHEGLAEALDWTKLWMLPNTAGCKTAEEAVRVARLGREMTKLLGQEENNFVKLEVIPDEQYLLPDPVGTLEAATQLVKEGFAVLPYINADPMLAKRLEEAGCATVMPLGSPIGSGQGLKTLANLRIIIENSQVPVVVDAGIGTPSEAAQAMELGADALLINTAIARAQNPVSMAKAMHLATEAGRLAFLAGRIPIKAQAIASSPLTGIVTSPKP